MARNREEGDELRKKLLRGLQENCARPNKDLAFDLKMDPSALSRLKDRLEKDGAIRAYKAVLDPMRFGLGTTVFINAALVDTDLPRVEETVRFLSSQPEVQEIHSIGGEYDMFVKIRVRANPDALKFVTTKMIPAHNIKDTSMMIILATYKETLDISI